jgi:hypothetical protein
MKKLVLMIVSLFLATSIASANPTAKMDMLSMSKADSSFLFNGKASVIALSGTEMKQTEGELAPIVPIILRIAIAATGREIAREVVEVIKETVEIWW